MHLDLRWEPGDDADAVAREIGHGGGRELHLGWGDLPWRHFADPSGNEFCLLPSRGWLRRAVRDGVAWSLVGPGS